MGGGGYISSRFQVVKYLRRRWKVKTILCPRWSSARVYIYISVTRQRPHSKDVSRNTQSICDVNMTMTNKGTKRGWQHCMMYYLNITINATITSRYTYYYNII